MYLKYCLQDTYRKWKHMALSIGYDWLRKD